ncbi:MAG: hypothetical protein KJZ92_02330 [Rhodocyclaceae bacterium]|nr:hypothetical protein [Rhodocyclaceae bacterium]MCC6878593.1 hypothetical protein [Rhodocyclaceae bacterium]MCL4680084.1 hypothetical protein [Rhodocyclaceae bacterium]
MRAHRFKQLAILLAIAALPAAAQSQSARHGTRDGVAVKATPLARSAVLSFYLARGFSAEAIAPYADACALSFEVQNNTKKPLRLRLADWRTGGAAGSISFRLPESWEDEWTRRGVAGPARIAFRWAQFQSELEFAPGDWIMGMATLARRPDGAFRLTIPYTLDKRKHEITLDRLACAAAD